MALTKTHIKRVLQAIKLADEVRACNCQKVHMGCVIFNGGGGAPVSTGINKMNKTHPGAGDLYDYPFPHAEFDALFNVPERSLRRATAYVARRRPDGTLGLARPCKYCIKYLKQRGIKTVYFTISNCEIGILDLRHEEEKVLEYEHER